MRRAVGGLVAVVLAIAGLTHPAGASAAGGAVARQSGADRANVILITTDDQTVADLRHMPHTRRLLGAAGATFTDAIAPFPLCCPARATLLTGQHAHNHGVLANVPPAGGWQALRPVQHRLLPAWLQAAGYRTTFTGKFLNTYGRRDKTEVPPGWDDWRATVHGVYDFGGAWVNENGVVVDRSETYQTDLTQQATADAIRTAARTGRPFFVWQSNLAPHGACTLAEDGSCQWGPPVPAERDAGTFAHLRLQSRQHPGFNERVVAEKPGSIQRLDPVPLARLEEVHRARVESLQAVDRNVRDTVALLRATGLLDDTLLIFASDNGYLLGEHRSKGKTLGYEPSLRVPLLVRGPGVPPGARIEDTVSLVDVAATIAAATGAEPLLRQDGISLVDVAAGRTRGYEAITIEAGPVTDDLTGDEYLYQGVRTPRYTYMEHPGSGEAELYDRQVDPGQLVNVAHRPTHARTRRALEDLLSGLADCVGAACRPRGVRIPPPAPPEGPVHPDELGTLGEAQQVLTLTAPSSEARTGTAVAWERRGPGWRVAHGPFPVTLDGGLSAGPGYHAGTPTGVHDMYAAVGSPSEEVGPITWRTPDALALESSRSAPREPLRLEGVDRALLVSRAPGQQLYAAPQVDAWLARLRRDLRPGSFLLQGPSAPGPGVASGMASGVASGAASGVAMAERDLDWLLRWADPAGMHTKVVVGTPEHAREAL